MLTINRVSYNTLALTMEKSKVIECLVKDNIELKEETLYFGNNKIDISDIFTFLRQTKKNLRFKVDYCKGKVLITSKLRTSNYDGYSFMPSSNVDISLVKKLMKIAMETLISFNIRQKVERNKYIESALGVNVRKNLSEFQSRLDELTKVHRNIALIYDEALDVMLIFRLANNCTSTNFNMDNLNKCLKEKENDLS